MGVLVEEASCDMEYLMIDKGSENDESVCDIGYYEKFQCPIQTVEISM